MSKINCLHISDLHLGESRKKSVESFYATICRDLKNRNQKIDLVICTGDLVLGALPKSAQLCQKAIDFFTHLLGRLNKESLYARTPLVVTDVLFVPGNHDVDRQRTDDKYTFYMEFLKGFYKEHFIELYTPENRFWFVTKCYPEEKIAFIGLNSCMGDYELSDTDREWLDTLDFTSENLAPTQEAGIRDIILQSRTSYDDYGEISTEQQLAAFDQLENQLGDLSAYAIVCFFHHHIYPFPEIYDRYGDSSMIRNFSHVINCLIDKNVRIVLHGHKHTPISRFITSNQYFENPRKSLYIFSTGTLTNDGNRGFEVVEIYSPHQLIEAKVDKYNYSGEELQHITPICVPPPNESYGNPTATFEDVLRRNDFQLYNWFVQEIKERDSVSLKYQIADIISSIEKTILCFEGISQELTHTPRLAALILFMIRYRVVASDTRYTQTDNHILTTHFRQAGKRIISDLDYLQVLFRWLEEDKSVLFNKQFKSIFDNPLFHAHKKETAYIAAVCLFTDLYLAISRFGESYFLKEGINHKINIKLEEGHFSLHVPGQSIRIQGDEDRRAAVISFKSKHPTAHKVGVLIVKDFEERICRIEEAFKELNLKIYYIRPSVEKEGYEMDNYNFEAYIPTLLPLLTGENLYAEREVFIRELIQNSYDAIKLRHIIDPDTDFDTTIRIKIGRDPKRQRRYLQITDHGTGMDLYTIERYFTSIGRSFYHSDDFAELQKDKNIHYQALSNFGIGFLSVFMVCTEVVVRTRNIQSGEGLHLHIPNYEGCFFINKDPEIDFFGTEIRLYEDDRHLIDTRNIKTFIETNFIDFCYAIKLEYSHKTIVYPAYRYRRELSDYSLFVPILEGKDGTYASKDYSFADVQKKKYIEGPDFGVSIDFQKKIDFYVDNHYLNAGIKVNDTLTDLFPVLFYTQLTANLPSSLLQLNVSREKIILFKKDIQHLIKKISGSLAQQALEMVQYIQEKQKEFSAFQVNKILCIAHQLCPSSKQLCLSRSFCMRIIPDYPNAYFFRLFPYGTPLTNETHFALQLNFDGSIVQGALMEDFINLLFMETRGQKTKLSNYFGQRKIKYLEDDFLENYNPNAERFSSLPYWEYLTKSFSSSIKNEDYNPLMIKRLTEDLLDDIKDIFIDLLLSDSLRDIEAQISAKQ